MDFRAHTNPKPNLVQKLTGANKNKPGTRRPPEPQVSFLRRVGNLTISEQYFFDQSLFYCMKVIDLDSEEEVEMNDQTILQSTTNNRTLLLFFIIIPMNTHQVLIIMLPLQLFDYFNVFHEHCHVATPSTVVYYCCYLTSYLNGSFGP